MAGYLAWIQHCVGSNSNKASLSNPLEQSDAENRQSHPLNAMVALVGRIASRLSNLQIAQPPTRDDLEVTLDAPSLRADSSKHFGPLASAQFSNSADQVAVYNAP